MPVIYRCDKGGPLTIEEIDGNFKTLVKRLDKLEGNPVPAERLATVEVNGQELYLLTDQGTKIGPINLPVVRWMPRGPWQAHKLYVPQELITYNEGLYLCEKSHTSTNFTAQKDCWTLILELPKQAAPSSTGQLPVYMHTELPATSTVGAMAIIIMDDGRRHLAFYDGEAWQLIAPKPIKS